MEESSIRNFGAPPRYPLESVDNALRLLSLFQTRDRLRVKDVAEELDVSTGTGHRLLAMLQYRGYVVRDDLTRTYMPGSMLLTIGLHASRSSQLRSAARPFLEELHARLDETIQLATLHGRAVMFIDGLESSKALRVVSRAGTLRPAHCTAAGKALLATLPAPHVKEIFDDEQLPQATPNSIGSRTELLAHLDAVRARGYAVNDGELEVGAGSVAVAVGGLAGTTVAVGAGAPLSRFDDDRVREIVEALRDVLGGLHVEPPG